MKICAIICEFNPFHNGHKYLIDRAREISGCDAVLCIMSGSFTQRGDICITDKYSRARHAVQSGADCVIELPVAFSVAPAEIFAAGAVKILSAIPDVRYLAFGCENGNKEDFISAARITVNESPRFKEALQESLASGESFVKSYEAAFESAGGKRGFLSKPNNVLGLEYTKALIRQNSDIEIIPVKRVGAEFGDCSLKKDFSSAGAIRKNINSPLVRGNVPECVFKDLRDFTAETEKYQAFIKLILSRTSAEDLSKVYGCVEGLENRLKSLQNLDFDKLIDGATSRRYASSRIKRILCANFLELRQSDCEEFLRAPLYLKPLAVTKGKADEILSALAKSTYPLILKKRDKALLTPVAQGCIEKDEFAYAQWCHIVQRDIGDYMITV